MTQPKQEIELKAFSPATKSHHHRQGNLSVWQMKQIQQEESEYINAPLYYFAKDCNREKRGVLENTTKPEAEKSRLEFDALVGAWKRATSHFSSERQQTAHITFLRIVARGKEALPFILDEFKQEPILGWLAALEAISGEDVASNAKTYKEAIQCWLDWGKKNGHLQS